MSATPAAVGAVLTTAEELDALPADTVVVGDPEGFDETEEYRRLSMQKRGDGYSAWWYPAWDTDIFNALASTEVVHRFGLGPFLVVWLPLTP